MSVCVISDVFLDILQAGEGGILRAGYLDSPVGRVGGGYIDSDPHDFPIAADGTFSLAPLWGSQTDPQTARVYLQFPDGNAWGGVVPSVSGPLTIEDLSTIYGWGVVSAAALPAITVSGFPGISITAFGASTSLADNIPAINAATTAAAGRTVIIPPGVFPIKPSPTNVITIPSNIQFAGSGPNCILQVASSTGDYADIFTATTADNVLFRDFTIDQNAAGNVSNPRSGFQQRVINLNGGKNNRIERMTFDTCTGVNSVVMNGSTVWDVSANNNRFNFAMPTGAADYDNSAMYIHGRNYTMEGNHFQTTIVPGSGGRACMEAHGGPASVTGNTSYGYRTGVNVVATAESRGGITVGQNSFMGACQAISLWDSSYGLRGVTVTGNTVDLAQFTHNQSVCHAINLIANGTNTGTSQDIIFDGNAVTCEDEWNGGLGRMNSFEDSTPILISAKLGENYLVGASAKGGCTGLTITDNIIENAPIRAIAIYGQSGTPTFRSVRVSGNTVINAGQNVAVDSSVRTAIAIGAPNNTIKDLVIEDNTITDTWDNAVQGEGGTRCVQAIDSDSSGSVVYQNVFSRRNLITSAGTPLTTKLNRAGISTGLTSYDPLGNTAFAVDTNGLTAISPQNNSTVGVGVLTVTQNPVTITQQSTNTADETWASGLEAAQFNAGTATTLGTVILSLKASGGILPADTVAATLRADNAGVPDTTIATALNLLYCGSLNTSTFTDSYFRFNDVALTPGANYWIVLSKSSSSTLFLGSRLDLGTNIAATSPDGTTWTLASGLKTLTLLTRTGQPDAIRTTALSGIGVRGSSTDGAGGSFVSTYWNGVEGNSTHFRGVSASSVYERGVFSTSTYNAGGEFRQGGTITAPVTTNVVNVQRLGTTSGSNTYSGALIYGNDAPVGNAATGPLLRLQSLGVDKIRVSQSGDLFLAGAVGFNGTNAVRQTITGSCGGIVALKNFFIAMANIGFITDNTTL